MRTVAHSLGTGAGLALRPRAGKEELLELVIERVIGEVDFGGEPDPERWQEQLKEQCARCGRCSAVTATSPAPHSRGSRSGENALRGSESMIGVMRAGGLPDQVIALAGDLLPLYVMAVAYEESLYGYENTTAEDFDEFIDRHAGLLRGAAARSLPQCRRAGGAAHRRRRR